MMLRLQHERAAAADPLGARILPLLRARCGKAGAGQARRHRHASGPDEPRRRDRPGHRRRRALGDHRPGRDGRRRAHGRARRPARRHARCRHDGRPLSSTMPGSSIRLGDDAVGAVLVEGGRIAGISQRRAAGRPRRAPIRVDAGAWSSRPVSSTCGCSPASRATSTAKRCHRPAMPRPPAVSPASSPCPIPAGHRRWRAGRLPRPPRAGDLPVNVLPAAAITKGLKGEEITEFGLLREAGAVAFTDGRASIQSARPAARRLQLCRNFDLPVSTLPRDNGCRRWRDERGAARDRLRPQGHPAEAETIPLARDLELAALTGVRYHAAQVSTARRRTAGRRQAPRGGVSAGISINNLSLNENDVGALPHLLQAVPPLRSEEDRRAMIEGLKSGAIDTIHSGHDPQDTEVKRQPFAEASDGAIGLETLLAAALRLHHSGDVPLMTLLRAMTIRPAEILGLACGPPAVGAPADFIVFDPDYPWQVKEGDFRSRSRNTAFEGARLAGRRGRNLRCRPARLQPCCSGGVTSMNCSSIADRHRLSARLHPVRAAADARRRHRHPPSARAISAPPTCCAPASRWPLQRRRCCSMRRQGRGGRADRPLPGSGS
jgi:dihydroorotase